VTDGLPVFWGDPCITIWVPEDDEPLPAIDRATLAALTVSAFERWSHVQCGEGRPAIDVHLGGALSCALTGYDPDAMQNVNTLRVVHEDWPHPGWLKDVAVTTVTSLAATGEIVDADIELNGEDNMFTVSDERIVDDLESALVHEAGHALGLAHSDEPDATMFASTRPGATTLRTLHPDDEAGICAIYAPQGDGDACAGKSTASNSSRVCEAVVTPRPPPGCSAARSGEASLSWAWLTLAVCAVLRYRRARPTGRALTRSPLASDQGRANAVVRSH
jgi:hypothetical protein